MIELIKRAIWILLEPILDDLIDQISINSWDFINMSYYEEYEIDKRELRKIIKRFFVGSDLI